MLVGIIHLLPLPGVPGAARLEARHGIAFADPDLAPQPHRRSASPRP